MYEAECAYHRPDGALQFLTDSQTPNDHADFAVLKVSFDVRDIFPPESDNGSGLTWEGGIAAISMRIVDQAFERTLRGDEYIAARDFLLLAHGTELWESGDDYAEALFYGEAA